MKSLIKKRIYRISAIVVTLLVCIAAVFVCNDDTTAVYADSDTLTAYESQNVLDDLEGSTIAGVEFDLANYPYDENGKPQILNFVEFGYSPYSNNQGDYNLYIYVYNPTGYEIKDSTVNNRINFEYASGNNADNYSLELLNYSTKSGYEGLFYKFKIVLSDSRRSAILKALNQSARVYSISAIDLCLNSSTAIDYEVGGTYTYSGYALGYGSTTATESSLTCTVDGFDRYINLDVQQTVYYPKGDYYDGEQVQLNSCYFGVPNSYLEDYGTLTSVFAEWYEYLTKPILVTENIDIYSAMATLKGQALSTLSNGYEYLFAGTGNTSSVLWGLGKDTDVLCWTTNDESNFEGNTTTYWNGIIDLSFKEDGGLNADTYFENFAAVFYTGRNTSYSDYSVSSKDLQSSFLTNSAYLAANGYSLDIVDRYCSYLFEDYIDSTGNTTEHVRGYNSLSITTDDILKIYTNSTTTEWWQNIFGGYTVTTDYDYEKAIVEVSYSDLSEYSDEYIADTYLINVNDVSDFKSYVKAANTNDETVYIMRYGCANYSSIPICQGYTVQGDDMVDTLCKDILIQWYDKNYSAYVCKETVYLNFDIISLTFTADDIDTVVPVVMSPQDVFSDTNPPLIEKYGSNCADISWTTILGILLLVFLLIICAPILPYIAKFIVWVVSLPFKLISEIYKAIKNKANKNKRE